MKILIADDNAQIRKVIIRLIKRVLKGNDFFECSNGEQAIEINAKEKPDLILMDIKMDKIDGLTATRRIHKEFPKTKVIIISQLSEQEYKEESFNAGAVYFLNKDCLIELPNKINEIINEK